MTQPEYELKKEECWEELWDEISGNIDFAPGVDDRMKEHIYDTFDRAYALGKQFGNSEQVDADTVIQGWVARDDGERWHERELHLFTRNKPERRKLMGDWMGRPSMMLDHSLFPDLTWESEPEEVEITIKRKKK